MLLKSLTRISLPIFIIMNMILGTVVAGVNSVSFPNGACAIDFKNTETKKIRSTEVINNGATSEDCPLVWTVHGDGTSRYQNDTVELRKEKIDNVVIKTSTREAEPPAPTLVVEDDVEETRLFCGCIPIRRPSRSSTSAATAVTGAKSTTKTEASKPKKDDGHYEDFLSFGGDPVPITQTFPFPSVQQSSFNFRTSEGLSELMPMLIVSQILFMHEVGRDNIKSGATLSFESKRVVLLDYSDGHRIRIEIPTPRGTKLTISLLKSTDSDSAHTPLLGFSKEWTRPTAQRDRPFFLTSKVMADNLTTATQ
ncbi:hypothetical protein [Spongorhabdus nitratireducens]